MEEVSRFSFIVCKLGYNLQLGITTLHNSMILSILNINSHRYVHPISNRTCTYYLFSVLASWFRLKYPHVALGALASSAPILYFDDITPQNGYYSVVTKDFRVRC